MKYLQEALKSFDKIDGHSADEMEFDLDGNAEQNDEPEICANCNGSGEGQYDGTKCRKCNGAGVIRSQPEETGPDYRHEEDEEIRWANTCPSCGSDDMVYSNKHKDWKCEACGKWVKKGSHEDEEQSIGHVTHDAILAKFPQARAKAMGLGVTGYYVKGKLVATWDQMERKGTWVGREDEEFDLGGPTTSAEPNQSAGNAEFDLGKPEGEEEPQSDDLDKIATQASEDPNRRGLIRTVPKAHLVFKRESENGTFEELWVFNVGDMKEEMKTRKAILAGTDIPTNNTESPDTKQEYTVWTNGNVEMIKVTGLPS